MDVHRPKNVFFSATDDTTESFDINTYSQLSVHLPLYEKHPKHLNCIPENLQVDRGIRVYCKGQVYHSDYRLFHEKLFRINI